MNLDIVIREQKEQPLLQRLEIQGRIVFEGATPSNVHVTEELAKKIKADANLIVLRHLYTQFGYQQVRFIAYVYQTQEARKKYEVVYPHLKKKEKQEASKPAAA